MDHTPRGVLKQSTPDSFAMMRLCHRQPAQDHNWDRVGHIAPELTRRPAVRMLTAVAASKSQEIALVGSPRLDLLMQRETC